jgi:hypothetical protein
MVLTVIELETARALAAYIRSVFIKCNAQLTLKIVKLKQVEMEKL